MLKKILILLFLLSAIIAAEGTDTLKLKLVENELPFGLVEYRSAACPTIALALSGGGSRGLAQLGVIRAIEESNIPISSIVGTSMGSIIGGLYSSGYSIGELDSIVINTPWLEFFSVEKTDRRELFIDQKVTEDRSLIALRMDGFTPVIPNSINTGLKVSNFINLLTLNAPIKYDQDFSELRYNFTAIATNLVEGKPYVLKSGDLSEALRASSSISFLLPPVQKDSILLVDGGVVANIPVEQAVAEGNDIILAVNSTSPLKGQDELVYPWEIADQLVSIPAKRLSEKQIEAADFIITPELNGIKNSDFSRIPFLIEQGYRSTLTYIKSIKQDIKSRFYSNIEHEKIYENLVVPEQPNGLEKKLINKYSNYQQISNKEILYDLYEEFKKGDYKDIKAEVKPLGENNVLKVYSEKNPEIKKIMFYGISLISENEFQECFKSVPNKPYNSHRILEATTQLIRKYRAKGYMLADITSMFFEDESHTLVINVHEGILDEIIISGNNKTNDDVIEREFKDLSGKPLHYEALKMALNNLRSSNLFSEIEAEIIQLDNKITLNIRVEERVTSLIRLGLRIDNEYKVQLHLDVREENLFGSGTELGAIVSGGERIRNYAVEHRANRIFDTYLTYKLRGYYQFNDVKTYKEDFRSNPRDFSSSEKGEYRQKFYGGSIGIGTQIQKFANLIAEGKYEYNEIIGLKDFPEEDTYSSKIVSLKLKLNVDSQDKYPYPTKGSLLTTFYETSQKFLGGDISYLKFYGDYHGFFNLNKNHNINFRVRFGFGDETLPLSQQFSFGGQENFFGYREYEYRGRQVLSGSFEYRYFLPVTIFFPTYLRARYDIGSIWANREDIRFADLKHGLGFSLSLDSPLGPADFSVGRSFILKSGEEGYFLSFGKVMFYFTIGYYF